MKELKQFIETYGYFGFIRFALYPLTTLITNPIITAISLINSLKLFFVKWKNYPHFDVKPMLNGYFYFTRAWNLKQYGRSGQSPYLGLGNYHLARCFNYSLFSLYSYWKGGAFAILIGMLGWWFAFWPWIDFDNAFDIIVWVMAISSTLFYVNTFRFQNYNALGWTFFPIGLYGLLTGDPMIAAAGWIGASFGSFTAVVLGTMLSGLYGLYHFDWLLMLSGVPASFKLLLHFYPFLTNKEAKSILKKVLGAIGASGDVKYKRKKTKAFNMKKLYFLALYFQFAFFWFLLTDQLPILMLAAILIYLLNALKIRFADDQSIHMLMLSIGTVMVFQFNDWGTVQPINDPAESSHATALFAIAQIMTNLFLFIPYWLLISPLPVLAGYDHRSKVMDILPISKPLNVSVLRAKVESFISPIKSGERVLFAFPDPDNQYEKVFDGYRQFIELPYYLAMQKDITMFPDWWAVFELNYEGATELWGTEPNAVNANRVEWNCDYVIVYENEKYPYDASKWLVDYEKVETMDWSQFEEMFAGYKKLRINDLKWHLLKPKKV